MTEQDIKIAQTKQEVDDFKAVIENFIGEMRDRDNKRDADIRELRKNHEEDMREFQKKHDEDMKKIQEKQDEIANELRMEIRETTKEIRSLTIAAVVGIVAIAVAVIAFVFVTWQSINQNLNYQSAIHNQNFIQPHNQNNLSQ